MLNMSFVIMNYYYYYYVNDKIHCKMLLCPHFSFVLFVLRHVEFLEFLRFGTVDFTHLAPDCLSPPALLPYQYHATPDCLIAAG